MKKILILISIFLTLAARSGEDYKYFVDLTQVKNDKVQVTLVPPDITVDEIDFLFPAMVPGTYEVYNFGRFISNFKVSGKDGAQIKVTKINSDTYRISPASKIDKITYEVDDTFDTTSVVDPKGKVVFEPGGTNFEENKNFSMNTHCMFGYFKGMTNRNFILEFKKPEGFYPATGLSNIQIGENHDVISVFDYHDLVDSPIMYFLPDTATVMAGKTKVLVASYSPNKLISANFIAGTIKELLHAQASYLGGDLPVDKYAFLFYFTDKATLSGAHGALEHSYSSFYVMPEIDSLIIQQQLRDVAAHEFFHIVTPLTIHAKEIGDFDFNDPKMSEHLWLYEGMTEYAAHHAQLKAGIIDLNQFLETMMMKYQTSLDAFNDTMSFTWMSKHVLEEKVHNQYANVYEKGAVIGMCLDILLRDLSDGKYGTQNLMKDLASKYGKDRSFNDEDLFNDIEKFTYPEVGTFLRKHVGGKTPLPMKDIFARIGIDMVKEREIYEFSLGNPEMNYNPETKRLFVEDISDLDTFGKKLGYKRGDEWLKLNGQEITLENIRDLISEYYNNVKEGDEVTIHVMRPKKGKFKEKKLSAKAQKVKIVKKNEISLMQELTEKQKQTLRTWAGIQY